MYRPNRRKISKKMSGRDKGSISDPFSPQKAQCLNKVSPFIGNDNINTLQKLTITLKRDHQGLKPAKDSSSKQTLTKDDLEKRSVELADLACKMIFTTPVTATYDKDVERCCDYVRSCSMMFKKSSEEERVFLQIMIAAFSKKLCERLTYKKCLQDLLKNRQIPLEKKEKWLESQCEAQEKLRKPTDHGSIMFLLGAFEFKPTYDLEVRSKYFEPIYQVLEDLFKLPNNNEILYDYINSLLDNINKKNPLCSYNSSLRKNGKLLERFQSIRNLAEQNPKVPQRTKDLLLKHWHGHFMVESNTKKRLYGFRKFR